MSKHIHVTLHQQSTPGFILYQTKFRFLIETQQKVLPYQSTLSIHRLTGQCEEITQKQFYDFVRNQQPLGHQRFWAIYGLIVVQEIPYLALVKQAQLITPQKLNPIFQIKNLIFIRFDTDKSIPQTEEQKKVLETINSEIVCENFYFSYNEDLTVCFKRKLRKQNDDSSESKFYWNQKNIQFIVQNEISKPWIVPIIQGYVDTISQNGIEYRVVARRSKHKSGTRYNNRGINLQGFASNFVEVQERIQYEDKIFTFITLRGSIPIYWSQQNNMSQIQFPETQEKDSKGLKKHYDSLNTDYQSTINTINLLSDTKNREKPLTQRFIKALKQCGIEQYFYFDLNGYSDDILHENIEKFVESYEQKVTTDNFEFYDTKTNKIISKQHHIPRVNCLDCIDRTNVICCRIGEKFVRKVAKILKIELSQSFHSQYLKNWANLGNKVSQIYCGTYSVAQHLTLKQEPSYWPSFTKTWRSVIRFFNANQYDSFKEQCNQYLLKEHEKSQTTYFSDHIFKYSLKPIDYCKFIDIDVTVITWNVGATSSEQMMQVDKMVFAEHIFGQNYQKAPGIIFITLQQIVELNSYNVVTNDNVAAKKSWQTIFLSVLNHYNIQNSGFTYTLYFSEALVGITSFVFVKNSLNPQIDMLNRIKKIFNYEVRRGYGEMLGNKGSIVSGFYIFDSVLINFACHLAAGDQKRKQRLQDVKSILDSVNINIDSRKVSKICDFMFFTGDLNFRLGSTDQQTRKLIDQAKKQQKEEQKFQNGLKNQTLYKLFKKDELFEIYSDENCLKKFHEYPIKFYPTYRYVKNGQQHDNKRKPAWTDRIFYFSQQKSNIHCGKYTTVDKVKISDHRAVIGEFKITVKHQDKQKKHNLIENFLRGGKKKSQIIQQPMYMLPKSRHNYE